MRTLAEARKLAAQLVLIFGGDPWGDTDEQTGRRVDVVLDQESASAALIDGRHAVLIGPPAVTYDTYSAATATWDVLLIANPPADRLAAWAALDDLLEAVRVDLDVDSARPVEWVPGTGTAYAALQLSCAIEYDLDDD